MTRPGLRVQLVADLRLHLECQGKQLSYHTRLARKREDYRGCMFLRERGNPETGRHWNARCPHQMAEGRLTKVIAGFNQASECKRERWRYKKRAKEKNTNLITTIQFTSTVRDYVKCRLRSKSEEREK